MEHFTESELRELTLTVMELHHINKTYLKESKSKRNSIYLKQLKKYYTKTIDIYKIDISKLIVASLFMSSQESESRLHKKTSQMVHPTTSTSLVDLPPEILIKIFSYLGPRDLCRMSQVHSSFSNLTFDGNLWRYLHPVCWAEGHWDFFIPLHTYKEVHPFVCLSVCLFIYLPVIIFIVIS